MRLEALACFLGLLVGASASTPNAIHRNLRVCTAISTNYMKWVSGMTPSFTGNETWYATVLPSENRLEGYYVDFMAEMHNDLTWDYEFRVYSSEDAALYWARTDACDFSMIPTVLDSSYPVCLTCPTFNPVNPGTGESATLTDCHCCTDFLMTHRSGGVATAVKVPTEDSFERLKNGLVNDGFIATLICCMALGIMVFGTLTWYVEKDHNEDFANCPVQGTNDGMWFALVTVTTVGYGDKAPRTGVGQGITGIWMLIGFIIFGALIGALSNHMSQDTASAFAATTLEGLKGKNVCANKGRDSSYIELLQPWGVRLVPDYGVEPTDTSQCYSLLESDQVDAIVDLSSTVLAHRKNTPSFQSGRIVNQITTEDYYFPIKYNSTLRADLNWAVMSLRERTSRWSDINERWFGDPDSEDDISTEDDFNIGLISTALAGIFVYSVLHFIKEPDCLFKHCPCDAPCRKKDGKAAAGGKAGTDEEAVGLNNGQKIELRPIDDNNGEKKNRDNGEPAVAVQRI